MMPHTARPGLALERIIGLAAVLKIYFDCGSKDSFGFDQGARAFHEELDALKVKHEFHIYSGGHGVE
jgi:S-formylglutathione hydrolase FrmB